MHQYPLHRISYCADDKGEKKFFSFIAKEEDAERHTCFVFVSDKLAEEITLTIGQAFGLAYRRFLDTSGKDLEAQRRCMVLQQKIWRLEHENNVFRQRLQDISAIKGSVGRWQTIFLQSTNAMTIMLSDSEQICLARFIVIVNFNQFFFYSCH